MKLVQAILWDHGQRRLRTGFRMLIQLTAFFVLMKALSAILGVPSEIAYSAPRWVILALAAVRLLRVLISVALAGRFLDRRPFADFGLSMDAIWWRELVLGMILGAVMISLIFVVEWAVSWVTIVEFFHVANGDRAFVVQLAPYVILIASVGFSEELMYRGYHQTNLAEGLNNPLLGPTWARVAPVVLSSVLFGVFHLGSPGATATSTFVIFAIGALLGVAYAVTGRLAFPIGIHITWNLFQGHVFGFPVSGMTLFADSITLLSIEQYGPELWTGGAFGPEGGLLALLVVLGTMVLILAWARTYLGRSARQTM